MESVFSRSLPINELAVPDLPPVNSSKRSNSTNSQAADSLSSNVLAKFSMYDSCLADAGKTTNEGQKYAEEGLPERRAAEWLNQFGESPIEDLPLDENEKKVVIGWLKRKNFVDLRFIIVINLILGGFNMIPVQPLDGSKVIMWSKPAYLGIIAAIFALAMVYWNSPVLG